MNEYILDSTGTMDMMPGFTVPAEPADSAAPADQTGSTSSSGPAGPDNRTGLTVESIPAPANRPVTACTPGLACDRDTILHLVELDDVDALVERSLLYGSEVQRAALATGA